MLQTDIKFQVELALATGEASQLPHKFTLTSDDGTVNQTLALASDAQPGDSDGTVVLTFTGLAEHHTYTLQCDNGDANYTVFKDVDYDQLHQIGPDSGSGSSAASTGGNGGGDSGDASGASGGPGPGEGS